MFAGSSVNKIGSNFFLGSPLLTIKIATKMKCYFDKLFFLEKEPSYFSVLEKRIEELMKIEKINWIKERYKVLKGDSNKNIEKILKNLDEKIINCLIFIDPNKAEHEWQSVEKLLNLRGDVLITFQSLLIAKEIGKAKSSHSLITKEKKEELIRCLGVSEEELSKLDNEEKVREYYIQKVKNYKKFVDTIHVKSGKSYSYYLIFGSSREDPPWKPIITSVKQYIESASGEKMKDFINVLLGKQSSLNGLSQQKRLSEYLNTTK
jgi:three-Cys-motif partner protein